MRNLLTVEDVAVRIGYTAGTLRNIISDARERFPSPREYGPYGRTYFAAEDIDRWNAGRKIKRRRRRKRT